MASSPEEICNIALTGHLGKAAISSIGESTKSGALTAIHYEPTRDALLRSHPWNFATRRVALAVESGYTPSHEYAYAHTLPADCLKVLRTNLEACGHTDNYRIERKTGGGRILLSDESSVSIEYISNGAAVGEYDALFVQVLALQLACAMCMNMTENASLLQTLQERMRQLQPTAQSVDAQEGSPRDTTAYTWLNARF